MCLCVALDMVYSCYGRCCCVLIVLCGCCRLLQVGLLPLKEAEVEAAKLKNLR